ncbi:MAG: helix-turn-helix domain-containing protein [Promethearchaeia archaeon]
MTEADKQFEQQQSIKREEIILEQAITIYETALDSDVISFREAKIRKLRQALNKLTGDRYAQLDSKLATLEANTRKMKELKNAELRINTDKVNNTDTNNFRKFVKQLEISKIQRDIMILLNRGPMPRSKIVTKLGKPRTTIYDNLRKLQKKNLVDKYPFNNGERGRPIIMWKLTNQEGV